MIIFSVYQTGKSEQTNRANHAVVRNTYPGLVGCRGVYKGEEERGFITSDDQLGRRLAKDYHQESYLELGYKGIWYLIETATGDIMATYRGIREISKAEAEKQEAYTEVNGKYYMGVL